ncbi:transglycosylase [Actinophytocola xinjiangensis]|uniref:Transglycosylase n=1 Tax=Actinophytocola xinjiangensis TaxID=485602 RepID=A0A7Z0WHW9_9PSEU|nr:transglycosylase family protein [Actinophytocola xinjiangensis]OLF06855.1 transglycosylase [Actinophytocola xinjiangensis]
MSGERWGARGLALLLLVGAVVVGGPAASADPSSQDWETLRQCESSGRYDVVASGGYYGAYQFDLATWRSVGGAGYPHEATPEEQDYRALYLYRMRGWQPWTCAGLHGLSEDADAGSERVPSYAESAYIGGAAPAWPGVAFEYGDCHSGLRVWQLRMNTYGFDFAGTGCYYEETRVAVLAVQRANGITESGVLGPLTWRAAWEGVSVSP